MIGSAWISTKVRERSWTPHSIDEAPIDRLTPSGLNGQHVAGTEDLRHWVNDDVVRIRAEFDRHNDIRSNRRR